MAQRVGMGANKNVSKKEADELKTLKSKNTKLDKENEALKAKVAELESQIEGYKEAQEKFNDSQAALVAENEALKAEMAKNQK